MNIELTKEEQNAINTLQRLKKRWPKSLWLFATGLSISVMRCDENGKRVYFDGHNKDGGVNPDYVVDSIDLPNDGGDW